MNQFEKGLIISMAAGVLLTGTQELKAKADTANDDQQVSVVTSNNNEETTSTQANQASAAVSSSDVSQNSSSETETETASSQQDDMTTKAATSTTTAVSETNAATQAKTSEMSTTTPASSASASETDTQSSEASLASDSSTNQTATVTKTTATKSTAAATQAASSTKTSSTDANVKKTLATTTTDAAVSLGINSLYSYFTSAQISATVAVAKEWATGNYEDVTEAPAYSAWYKAMNAGTNSSATKFSDTLSADQTTIDFSNLSADQLEELSLFYVNVLNGLYNKLGISSYVATNKVTNGSLKYASYVSDYTVKHWNGTFAHYLTALRYGSYQTGLIDSYSTTDEYATTNNYGEAAVLQTEFGWNSVSYIKKARTSTTMADAKADIINALELMLFEDEAEDMGHAIDQLNWLYSNTEARSVIYRSAAINMISNSRIDWSKVTSEVNSTTSFSDTTSLPNWTMAVSTYLHFLGMAPGYSNSSIIYGTASSAQKTRYNNANWTSLNNVGFVTSNGKTYYYDLNGNKYTGQHYIDGHWYNFDSNGVMSTGVTYIASQKKLVLYNTSGQMLYGSQTVSGKKFTFDTTTGALKATGQVYIGGHWYLLNSKYQPQTGFQYISNQKKTVYYSPKTSYMLYGQQYIGGYWYLFNKIT
ncbi:SEC10/PgrA surface exclusion domain-containing protein, partial [Ligilactobacillus sp. WC1T17]